jgi:hypothetical protein
MSVSVRWEQCCESEGCKRPAHYGLLCAVCFMAATPARRVVELEADRHGPPWPVPSTQTAPLVWRTVGPDGPQIDPLEALWLLPAAGCGES